MELDTRKRLAIILAWFLCLSVFGQGTGYHGNFNGNGGKGALPGQTGLTNLNISGPAVTTNSDGSLTITGGTNQPANASPVIVPAPGATLVQTNQWVNVQQYGAVPDGATDNQTAINNAIAAIPPTGGVLYFPGSANGGNVYLTSGGHLIGKPVAIVGSSRGQLFYGNGATSGASTVLLNSTTGFLFKFTNSFSCANIQLAGSYSATGGALIWVTNSGPTGNFTSFDIYNTTFQYGWQQLLIDSGQHFNVTASHFFDFVREGICVSSNNPPDIGSSHILNDYLMTSTPDPPTPLTRMATACIHLYAGGNLDIGDCNMDALYGQAWSNNIRVDFGNVSQTTGLIIHDCNLDSSYGDAILMQSDSGTAYQYPWSFIDIHDNKCDTDWSTDIAGSVFCRLKDAVGQNANIHDNLILEWPSISVAPIFLTNVGFITIGTIRVSDGAQLQSGYYATNMNGPVVFDGILDDTPTMTYNVSQGYGPVVNGQTTLNGYGPNLIVTNPNTSEIAGVLPGETSIYQEAGSGSGSRFVSFVGGVDTWDLFDSATAWTLYDDVHGNAIINASPNDALTLENTTIQGQQPGLIGYSYLEFLSSFTNGYNSAIHFDFTGVNGYGTNQTMEPFEMLATSNTFRMFSPYFNQGFWSIAAGTTLSSSPYLSFDTNVFFQAGATMGLGKFTNTSQTANSVAIWDANQTLESATVGSGLSLSGGVLSAGGGGSYPSFNPTNFNTNNGYVSTLSQSTNQIITNIYPNSGVTNITGGTDNSHINGTNVSASFLATNHFGPGYFDDETQAGTTLINSAGVASFSFIDTGNESANFLYTDSGGDFHNGTFGSGLSFSGGTVTATGSGASSFNATITNGFASFTTGTSNITERYTFNPSNTIVHIIGDSYADVSSAYLPAANYWPSAFVAQLQSQGIWVSNYAINGNTMSQFYADQWNSETEGDIAKEPAGKTKILIIGSYVNEYNGSSPDAFNNFTNYYGAIVIQAHGLGLQVMSMTGPPCIQATVPTPYPCLVARKAMNDFVINPPSQDRKVEWVVDTQKYMHNPSAQGVTGEYYTDGVHPSGISATNIANEIWFQFSHPPSYGGAVDAPAANNPLMANGTNVILFVPTNAASGTLSSNVPTVIFDAGSNVYNVNNLTANNFAGNGTNLLGVVTTNNASVNYEPVFTGTGTGINGITWEPATNTTVPTTVTTTNFLLSTTYSNGTGSTLLISSAYTNQIAAVLGNSTITITISNAGYSSPSNYVLGMNSLITSISMVYSNTFTLPVSTNGTYSIANTSTGTGNVSGLITGTGTIVAIGNQSASTTVQGTNVIFNTIGSGLGSSPTANMAFGAVGAVGTNSQSANFTFGAPINVNTGSIGAFSSFAMNVTNTSGSPIVATGLATWKTNAVAAGGWSVTNDAIFTFSIFYGIYTNVLYLPIN